jgi:hypothetical protein
MNINKAIKRDNKRNKKKNGMRISGRSVFVIQDIQIKKARKIKQNRENNKE